MLQCCHNRERDCSRHKEYKEEDNEGHKYGVTTDREGCPLSQSCYGRYCNNYKGHKDEDNDGDKHRAACHCNVAVTLNRIVAMVRDISITKVVRSRIVTVARDTRRRIMSRGTNAAV